ncbi:PhoH family protein [Candidatus Saccharibacteria bacterium]|nr:PhoH family protein [Candidatus Saccharibacteria bacterium]
MSKKNGYKKNSQASFRRRNAENGFFPGERRGEKRRPRYHEIIVPALDVLIGDPNILSPSASTKRKADLLLIPEFYIGKISRLQDEQSSRGEATKVLTGRLVEILKTLHDEVEDKFLCENGMEIRIVRMNELDVKLRDDASGSTSQHTIATAKAYAERYPKQKLAIMTGDDNVSAKAYLSGFDVAHINDTVYTGRRKVVMDEADISNWRHKGYITIEDWQEHYPNEAPLRCNEFVEFIVDEVTRRQYPAVGAFVGRFEPFVKGDDRPCIQKLHYIDNAPRFIKPWTAGQAMFMEALLAPVDEIPIVICPSVFGTGKTFLATSIGLHLATGKRARFEQIFVCPRDAKLGDEIGFLPGSEREKTIAKAMPIVDNIRAYLKAQNNKEQGGFEKGRAQIDKEINELLEKYFSFVPIINMGGRSIANSWIIYDEFQDTERFQAQQLMKRTGDGSKIIVMGDPLQRTNRHINHNSNGLSYAASKLAGNKYAAVIKMDRDEITRSDAAKVIAEAFDG